MIMSITTINEIAARLAEFMLANVAMPGEERDERLAEMIAFLAPEDQAAAVAEAEATLKRLAADAAALNDAALTVIAIAGNLPTGARE
ncbi:hypothetical protein CH338_05380 [Rhodoplanes elegans]|uniref:Uncharacterized protein n=2 Tax=Rhodoplanes elegans TaxID=29408 RepID=A0A327KP98_9BRAD|nr:hypothetical protein CH338_05380 [Rhodoplanes elegans]